MKVYEPPKVNEVHTFASAWHWMQVDSNYLHNITKEFPHIVLASFGTIEGDK